MDPQSHQSLHPKEKLVVKINRLLKFTSSLGRRFPTAALAFMKRNKYIFYYQHIGLPNHLAPLLRPIADQQEGMGAIAPGALIAKPPVGTKLADGPT